VCCFEYFYENGKSCLVLVVHVTTIVKNLGLYVTMIEFRKLLQNLHVFGIFYRQYHVSLQFGLQVISASQSVNK